MKKFMFSAVALVAFSFAGIANNSVEKEVVEKKPTSVEKEVALKGDNVCNEVWHSQVAFYQANGATISNAIILANEGFEQCLCNVYGVN